MPSERVVERLQLGRSRLTAARGHLPAVAPGRLLAQYRSESATWPKGVDEPDAKCRDCHRGRARGTRSKHRGKMPGSSMGSSTWRGAGKALSARGWRQ